jgi:hypothetical protein
MAKRKGEQDDVQKTSLKLPAGLWREVRAAAILQGKTGNQLVVEALQRIIKESKGGRS